jgi:hypothetical protein
VTKAKTLALTAGLAGAIGLGVWAVPRLMDRDRRSTDGMVATITEPAAAIAEKAPAPRRAARVNKVDKVAALPASTAAVHDRLKPVLNRGTKMEIAAEGFASAEQFATVAYAARNTGVPFMVLKHRVLDEGKTLAAAIRESQPGVNAAAEVARARQAAQHDLSSLVS